MVSFFTGIFTFTDMGTVVEKLKTLYIYINNNENLSTKSRRHVETNVNT
jgi:hypothetical protein